MFRWSLVAAWWFPGRIAQRRRLFQLSLGPSFPAQSLTDPLPRLEAIPFFYGSFTESVSLKGARWPKRGTSKFWSGGQCPFLDQVVYGLLHELGFCLGALYSSLIGGKRAPMRVDRPLCAVIDFFPTLPLSWKLSCVKVWPGRAVRRGSCPALGSSKPAWKSRKSTWKCPWSHQRRLEGLARCSECGCIRPDPGPSQTLRWSSWGLSLPGGAGASWKARRDFPSLSRSIGSGWSCRSPARSGASVAAWRGLSTGFECW